MSIAHFLDILVVDHPLDLSFVLLSGEEESPVLPPLFLTEFDLNVEVLSFLPSVDNFHEALGDVITR